MLCMEKTKRNSVLYFLGTIYSFPHSSNMLFSSQDFFIHNIACYSIKHPLKCLIYIYPTSLMGIVANEYQGLILHFFSYACQGTFKLTLKIGSKAEIHFTFY